MNDILDYKHENLFFLKKKKIKTIIEKYNLIEDYNIYKRYPSKMVVNLKKTKFSRCNSKMEIIFILVLMAILLKLKILKLIYQSYLEKLI